MAKKIKNSITARSSNTHHPQHSTWKRKGCIQVFYWVFLLILLCAVLGMNVSVLLLLAPIHREANNNSDDKQQQPQQPQQLYSESLSQHFSFSDSKNDNRQPPPLQQQQQQQQQQQSLAFFYRSPSLRLQAQACVRAGGHQGNIYIKHFRKTGGSTLNKALFLQGLCHKTNRIYASEYPYFNANTFESLLPLEATVYITALRHPVDRILSMYWYEGRWPRTCGVHCEAAKIKNDSTKVADLEDWIEAVYHQTHLQPYRLAPHTACGQWQSVENYYVRQLIGMDRGRQQQQPDADNTTTTAPFVFLNRTITRNDLELAKAILDNFDLVLISEHFSGEHYDEDMIYMFLDITGALDHDGDNKKKGNFTLPHHRKGLERATLFQEPHPDTVKRLLELNRWDLELYQYAIQLKQQRVNEWKEQQQQNTRNLLQCKLQDRDSDGENNKTDPMLSHAVYETALSGEACPPFRGPYYFFRPQCLLHSYPPPAPVSLPSLQQSQYQPGATTTTTTKS